MPLSEGRSATCILALALALLAFAPLSRTAHAGWGAEPVQVHATTAECPLVAACDDSHGGAVIVWQEATATGGLLKARRLLADGELDPAWAGPVLVSSADTLREALGAVRDGLGGAYIWWMEGAKFLLTRVSPEGKIAAGWPARGRLIGILVMSGRRPDICADGTGGIYVTWLTIVQMPFPSSGAYPVVKANHIGPDNTPLGSWPSGGRVVFDGLDTGDFPTSIGICAASDGGLWFTCAVVAGLEWSWYPPGTIRLLRFTRNGTPIAGWSKEGVTLGPYPGDVISGTSSWEYHFPRRQVSTVTESGGHAYVLFADISREGYFVLWPRLQKVDGTGAIAPGWPEGGLPLEGAGGFNQTLAGPPDQSFRIFPDRNGGVLVGLPGAYTDGGDVFSIDRFGPDGVRLCHDMEFSSSNLHCVDRGDGGVVAASFESNGPCGYFDPAAYLMVLHSQSGLRFSEWHDEHCVHWYGDIGLAATGDGGSIFAWSQVYQRFGVFAVRVNSTGQVTSVPPLSAPRGSRAWFVRGTGVRVSGATGRVSLHDLSGREVAAGTAADAGEWTLPGTAGLASGLYFARVPGGGLQRGAKVVVVR